MSGVAFVSKNKGGLKNLLDYCIKTITIDRQIEMKTLETVESCPSNIINTISIWNREDCFYKKESLIVIKSLELNYNKNNTNKNVNTTKSKYFFGDLHFFADEYTEDLEFFLFEKFKFILLDKSNYPKNFIPFVSHDFDLITVCDPESLSSLLITKKKKNI